MPHDSEPDSIESILFEFLHVLLGKRHVLIEGISFGEKGKNFDGNVHSMEEDLSVLFVEDVAVLDCETEDRSECNAEEKKDLFGRNEISDHGLLIKYFIKATFRNLQLKP